MHLSGYAMFLLVGSFWLVSSLQPLYRSPRSIRHSGRYLVHLQEGASEEELLHQLREGNEDKANPEFKAHTLSMLKSAVNGFVGKLSPKALDMVRKSSLVEYVEEDFMVFGGGVTERDFSREAPRSRWGLDRLDQKCLPLNNSFKQPCKLTGEGVDVYVMDSGIRYSHEEFDGRAAYPGCDPYGEMDGGHIRGQDCNGHGTHVAGIVGGKNVGVAPDVNLYSVRVLGCQLMGTMTSIVAGIDCIINHHNGTGRPAVINASIFGKKSKTVNRAVKKALRLGIHFVTIAGNSGEGNQPNTACSVSPGCVRYALTVGATNIDDHVYFESNIGSCVNLFAPGEEITSASYARDYQMRSSSGTSFAAPYVAGAVALILQRCPNMTTRAMHRIVSRELTTSNKVNFTTFLNVPEASAAPVINATSGASTQQLVDDTRNRLLYLGGMCTSKGRFKVQIRRRCSP